MSHDLAMSHNLARPAAARQPIVIWFGRVGDLILLSTLLDILHRRYGSPCRLVGAGAWIADIYRTHRDIAEVIYVRRYTPFVFDPAWWRSLFALRRGGGGRRSGGPVAGDPVYVCETDPRKLKRIRRLLTLSDTDPARCLFITEEASCQQPHWVDKLVSFGRLTPKALTGSDYPWPTAPPPLCAPRLEVSPEARADCDAWVQEKGWSGRPLVLIQPGNRRTMRGKQLQISPADDKSWPIERWAELLRKVHAHLPEAAIVLCGAPRETLLLEWIHAAVNLPNAVFAAELPMGRLLALCASAHSMISVDTGPAHAAAALGLPLVVMFGGQPPAQWQPRSSSGSPVIGIGGPPELRRMDEIPAQRTFEAWLTLLEQARR
jgi:ADP-heptose:LPS heptosyltransferase